MFIIIKNFLHKKVKDIKELLMERYDTLNNFIVNNNSVANPELYRESFKKYIDEFSYLDKEDDNLVLNIPDIDTFDFSELNLIKHVLEGTSGNYVEISEEDVVKIDRSLVLNKEAIDVPGRGNFYLIRYTGEIKKAEKHILEKKLILFPFSNTPPLYENVFGKVISKVDKNIDKWIDEALEEQT